MSAALAIWRRKLEFLLAEEPKIVDPEARFALKTRIEEARARIALLEGASPGAGAAFACDIQRLSRYAPVHLRGREAERDQLDTAWKQAVAGAEGRTRILIFEAMGGEGKTALVADWLVAMAGRYWPGCDSVFAWSFYSQGASEKAQATDDVFLAEALTFFGDAEMAASPADAHTKGHRLAQLVAARRTILALDGLEPLQWPPSSPLRGTLKAFGVAALLAGLATNGGRALCLVTTRLAVADLAAFDGRGVATCALTRLPGEAGVALLRDQGVKGEDGELATLVEAHGGHALSLTILGAYLREAFAGDVRKSDRIVFRKADETEAGGHAFRVVAAYVGWLDGAGAGAPAGALGACMAALLRLTGLFDRPMDAAAFAVLTAPPGIAGLTDALEGLAEDDIAVALTRLAETRLLTVRRDDANPLIEIDAHPLIRDYFADDLARRRPEAFRAGHARLFDHLVETTKEGKAPTLADLQPLYHAVAHGCRAGRAQEALDEVFWRRIRLGNAHYSLRNLGAFGADLGALASFFVDAGWRTPEPSLSQAAQSFLLGAAAFCLLALGRLAEAAAPMREGLGRRVAAEDWDNAARSADSLSELAMLRGDVGVARADAEAAVAHADRHAAASGDGFLAMATRTTLADALALAGERPAAVDLFEEAERRQRDFQPDCPRLYSLRGFQYCDLLLAEVFAAARRRRLGVEGDVAPAQATCAAVRARAATTLDWATPRGDLLSIALDRLTLGRTRLLAASLADDAAGRRAACADLDAAVAALRKAGAIDHIARGLIDRAWARAEGLDLAGAQADLDEAHRFAARGPMKLHLCDIHLRRALLFGRAAAYPWGSVADDLAAARDLIETCGFGARREELADLEAALPGARRD